ncbi:MAG: transposase [Bacteroidetes bacterium]|nr:transposase [Bacteroidota bacterium]
MTGTIFGGAYKSFNGKQRDEYLSVHWFFSMQDAYQKITSWKDDDNHFRPHRTLGDISSEEFINQITFSAEFSTFDLSKQLGGGRFY